jgi:hypothetical protein
MDQIINTISKLLLHSEYLEIFSMPPFHSYNVKELSKVSLDN